MAMVRRHWALALAIPILLVTCVLLVFQEMGTGKVRAQLAPTPDGNTSNAVTPAFVPPGTRPAETPEARADAESYKNIQKLRSELCLTQQDLAALGLSSQSASNVLNAIKVFMVSSAGSLQGAEAGIQSAQQVLAEAARKIRVGPRDETVIASVATLKQNVAQAQLQRDAVLGALVAQVNGSLTPDQQALWAAARSYQVPGDQPKGLGQAVVPPGPYRYVAGLSDAQIRKLQLLARQSGTTAVLNPGTDVVSPNQVALAQTVNQQQRVAISAVAAAEEQVLPVPILLQPGAPMQVTFRPTQPVLAK